MKKALKILPVLIVVFACSQGKEVFQYNDKEYWSIDGKIDSTKIMDDVDIYYNGTDTLLDWKSYYINGQQRAHVKFGENRIIEIYNVYDTLGNKLDFGKLKNGNGYIYIWDRDGYLHESGSLVEGKRDGWWRSYHYKGEVLDSSFYTQGKLEDMGDFEFCYY